MNNSAMRPASKGKNDAERAIYAKPQLTQLGNVADITRTSVTFSNLADSSNILGSDYS